MYKTRNDVNPLHSAVEPPSALLLSRPIYLAVRVRILFIDAAALTYLLDYPAYCQLGKEVSDSLGQN